MSLSSHDVWQKIEAQGLASAQQCREWAAMAAKAIPASDADVGIRLIQTLVRQGRLTKYQASVLLGKRKSLLRVGKWLIRGNIKDPKWKGWIEVGTPPGAGSEAERRWARIVSAADIQHLRPLAPSLEFAHQQAAVQAPGLLRTFTPEGLGQRILLSIAPVKGQRLDDLLGAELPLSPEAAHKLVRQVAGALAGLHAAGLAHGSLRPDWVTKDGDSILLLRDPLCRFPSSISDKSKNGTSIDGKSAGILGHAVTPLWAAQFLAPEFIVAGQLPNSVTDVYALGCLWWWLLTGKPPVAGDSPKKVLSAAAFHKLRLPPSVRLSPAVERVLQHTLSSQPAHRFATAIQFCTALDKAVALGSLQPVDRQASRPEADSQPHSVSAPERDSSQSTTERTSKRRARVDLDKSGVQSPETVPASAAPTARRPGPRPIVRRRRANGKWLVRVVAGGSGLLILILLALHFSGALRNMSTNARSAGPPNRSVPSQPGADPAEPNPLTDEYVIVDAGQDVLWAPPAQTTPLSFELLPPGGQCFVSLRPTHFQASQLLSSFPSEDESAGQRLLQFLSRNSGVDSAQIARCTIAFYAADPAGTWPEFAVRIDLTKDRPVSQLRAQWLREETAPSATQDLYTAGDTAYFVRRSDPDSMVKSFSFGPVKLMQEVASAGGAEGPMLPHMERLRRSSDAEADFVLLAAPPYLFTEGRGLMELLPERLRAGLPELIGADSRGILLQSRFAPKWYWEGRIIGQSDQFAGRIAARLESELLDLPRRIEEWLVAEAPPAYWRGLALRYPQMLRTLADYSRFGVEDSMAVMNCYLPSYAADNLLLTSWIAARETAAADSGTSPVTSEKTPLTIDEYLARPIRVSFDQEPLEDALQIVGEEANAELPPGSRPLRFGLDGDAFENAGITRNQQLRDFSIDNRPVRVALTEIARRGNPATNVTDMRDPEQQLVWIVQQDPQDSSAQMILFTTRMAALAAGSNLPAEFTQ